MIYIKLYHVYWKSKNKWETKYIYWNPSYMSNMISLSESDSLEEAKGIARSLLKEEFKNYKIKEECVDYGY